MLILLPFSRPGKPTDHPYIELLNGSFRYECLNAHWFLSLEDAKEKMKSGGKNTTTSGTTAVWGI